MLIFLILSRLLLNIPIFIGATYFTTGEIVGMGAGVNPLTWPGLWARWNSEHYLKIATQGYSFYGPDLNFFPFYPLTIWLFSFGLPAFMPWAGFLISNLAFILAGLLLWDQVSSDFDETVAWATLITLSLFPTAFFFSAIYTESLFLLLAVLVYFFSARKQYLYAGLCVSLASITRIPGILLIVIPLIEIGVNKPPRWRWWGLMTGLLSSVGLIFYGGYMWLTQGNPFTFLITEQIYMKRSLTWPGKSLLDALGVILWGYGGFEHNRLMRMIMLQDFLALSLFFACAVLSIFLLKRKSLIIYFWLVILMLLVSHGPFTLGVYAMARYVLLLFPGFMVMGLLLARLPRLKWLVWAVSGTGLMFLTLWFGTGHWVA